MNSASQWFARLAQLGVPIVESLADRPDVSNRAADVIAVMQTGTVYRAEDGAWVAWWGDTADQPVLNVSEYGFTGDLDDGDIGRFILDHPDAQIILPNGSYSVGTRIDISDAWGAQLSIMGAPNARLVPANGIDRLFTIGSRARGFSGHVSLANLTLDVTHADCAFGYFYIDRCCYHHNLSTRGRRDHGSGGSRVHYLSNVTSDSGVAIHESIRLPDGDSIKTSPSANAAIGFRGGESTHRGTNVWIGCHVEEFWDNGFYLSGTGQTGRNVLLGCTAKNCGRQMIRLGGHDTAINCAAILDKEIEMGMTAMLAVRDTGELVEYPKTTGWASVIGCELYRTADGDAGPRRSVMISDTSYASIRDCRITNASDYHAIYIGGASDDDHLGHIVFDNIRVHDTGGTRIRAAPVRIARPGVIMRNATITAEHRPAIEIEASSVEPTVVFTDCRIQGSTASLRIRPVESGFVTIRGGYLNTGIHLTENDRQLDHISISNVDLRDLSSDGLWVNASADDLDIPCAITHNIGWDTNASPGRGKR